MILAAFSYVLLITWVVCDFPRVCKSSSVWWILHS